MSEKSTSSRLWTGPQRAAIEHVHGDLLVSAAAGSGKTAVLAERCARLVCAGGEGSGGGAGGGRTGVENLLVLTFTEAAAGEMRSRIAAALRAKQNTAAPTAQRWLRRQAAMVDRASISTLHAFCMRILRQHFHEAQVDPAFEIMDEEESRLLQDEVLEQLLARWHKLPAVRSTAFRLSSPAPDDAPLTAAAFGDFFEAYAQGRESICRELILALHRMLASTADPEAYVAAARGLYWAGAEGTFAAYNNSTLMNRLRLARLATQRACDEVAQFPGTGQMLEGLRNARNALDAAANILAEATTDYPTAWARVRESLDVAWPLRLKSVKEIPEFDALKKRTYQATKDLLVKLASLFAPDPAAMLRDLRALALPLETLLALTREFDAAFTAAKRADNRLDFSDLERLAHKLLMQPHSLARAELRQRYHFILVDEFQDINPLQEALLEAVRNPAAAGGGRASGNLFVVGDLKQSIYAFRLAQPELFLARQRAARAAQAADPAGTPAHVDLQHNFRSHPGLLAAMNRIFEKILTPEVVGINYNDGHDLQPPPSHPQTAPSNPETNPSSPVSAPIAIPGPTPSPTQAAPAPFTGTPIELHLVTMDSGTGDADDDTDERSDRDDADEAQANDGLPGSASSEKLSAVEQEAQVVADRIAALLRENRTVHDKEGAPAPLRPRHIAILLRTMKNKAMIFARALADRGIPMHADLSSGFFDTTEVKDALALLQVLDNPQQDIPLATVMLGPYGRFTHDDLALIRLAFDRKEVPFALAVGHLAAPGSSPDISAFRVAQAAIPPDLAARLRVLFETLARWRGLLRARPLHEGLAEIFSESKILAYVAGLDTGQQRVANLQFLHQRALKFSTFKKQGLHRFLRFIEKLRDQESGGYGGGDVGEAPVLSEASDVVRILSIHKSKGLEFPVVFVSGLGGKLRLTAPGPVLLHRDLGVGLYAADIDRNIAYPSAAALRIADEQRKAFRAEELRLLYVALTRAREGLILTGHIAKAAEIDTWRQACGGADGRQPLPEDLLLKGTRALDWLMPALATGRAVAANAAGKAAADQRLSICWDGGQPAAGSAQVVVYQHAPQPEAPAPGGDAGDDSAAFIAKLVAGEPIDASVADPRVEHMIRRVTGTYAFEEFALRPAVQTVSFLKTLADGRADAGETEAVPVAQIGQPNMSVEEIGAQTGPAQAALKAEAARHRGIATHRVLELLDFTQCASTEAVAAQIEKLIERKELTLAEAERADWSGIHWFVRESAAGQRVCAAAHLIRAGENRAPQLRRELAFTWLAEPERARPPEGGTPNGTPNNTPTGDPDDLPTIRGVIDLLLVDTKARTAEILDYKTDRLWEAGLDDYRRQMRYYLAAASDILGFTVARATLVFLSPRREIVIANP